MEPVILSGKSLFEILVPIPPIKKSLPHKYYVEINKKAFALIPEKRKEKERSSMGFFAEKEPPDIIGL